jgi:hypothetical protein
MDLPLIFFGGDGDNHIDAAVLEELKAEGRGPLLLAAALVETRLEDALRVSFVNDKKVIDSALGAEGPIGSFSAKISMSYLLGIISKTAKDDLTIIRKVRNFAAHELFHNSFEHPDISSRCMSLKTPDMYFGGMDSTKPFRSTRVPQGLQSPRQRYIGATTVIAFRVGAGAASALNDQKPYI